jgi:hypothetical protein
MPRRLKHLKVTDACLCMSSVANKRYGSGFLSVEFPERHWNSLYKHLDVAMKVMVAALDAKWPHPKFRASKVVNRQDAKP